MFIGGTTIGDVNPHVNLGYTFGGKGMAFGADDRWLGSFGDPELIRALAVGRVQLHGGCGHRREPASSPSPAT